jgi:hypothetical protein
MTASRTGVAMPSACCCVTGGCEREGIPARTDGLMWAAAEGNLATAQLLLKAGADLHTRENGGFTPLLFAVRQGKIDVVRTLLKAGQRRRDFE